MVVSCFAGGGGDLEIRFRALLGVDYSRIGDKGVVELAEVNEESNVASIHVVVHGAYT
jgi:hypothetical protein